MNGLSWFLRVLRAFARRELMVVTSYRAAFLVRGLSFVFAVVSLVFFSRFVDAGQNPHLAPYGGNYLAFTLVGIVVVGLQQVGLSELAQRIRMAQLMGTLEAELSTPAPAWIVLGAGPLYAMGGAALRAVVYLLGAAALLGVGLGKANLLSVAVGVPLILAAFWGLGLLSAAATMVVRRANPVALIMGTLSVFLSGVMYPISVLPDWLRGLGGLLPLTHALEVLRGALLLGATPAALGSSLRALALFAVLLVAAGTATFVYALRRARVDGSLTHY